MIVDRYHQRFITREYTTVYIITRALQSRAYILAHFERKSRDHWSSSTGVNKRTAEDNTYNGMVSGPVLAAQLFFLNMSQTIFFFLLFSPAILPPYLCFTAGLLALSKGFIILPPPPPPPPPHEFLRFLSPIHWTGLVRHSLPQLADFQPDCCLLALVCFLRRSMTTM